jgi:hypothetical protein
VTVGLSLGAPGIYHSAAPPSPGGVEPIRLDATGFVGVAWRGPANEPVAVTSWTQFVEVFGSVTDPGGRPCPGYLPRAVRAYFDQGGQIAWVCRVVPVTTDERASARLELDGLDVSLVAANEGSWGGLLEATLTYDTGPPLPRPQPGQTVAGDGHQVTEDQLVVPDIPPLPAGSLLLLRPSSTDPTGTLHWLVGQRLCPGAPAGRVRVLTVEPAPPPEAVDGSASGRGVDVRVVTATLTVIDRDPQRRRSERITGLGLDPAHPRFPARQLPPDHPGYPGRLLAYESRLVRTGDKWKDRIGPADGTLAQVASRLAHGGQDRFAEIDGGSFFDPDSPDGDLLDGSAGHRGVDRVGRVADLGLLCVPDLTWSAGTGDGQMPGDISEASHLDPQDDQDRVDIISRQRKLVAVADVRQRMVALLDAPSRLSAADLARWRAEFDSSFAAAYYPWLGVPGDGPGRRAVLIPPSAVAAGVIASRERRLGLPWGPANELAATAVTAGDLVPDAVHDELHRAGINVFRAERDGFRLSSARTLSRDVRYRQLSVRRLMTMITLSVQRQAQWLVFEPNTPGLRAALFHTLSQFLGDLYRRGAFAGDTEQSSFFVRCDDRLNPAQALAQGRLVAEIGVAPSSPLEYLVLRISQDTDGGTSVAPAGAAGSSTSGGTRPGGAS